MKITPLYATLASETSCYYIVLSINNKNIDILTRTSFNSYMGCYCNKGWELLNEDISLTKEERKAINDHVSLLDTIRIKLNSMLCLNSDYESKIQND
jgi:hypothetical protein